MQNRILLVCLFLSGYAGLAYELLWIRLLTQSFGSTTQSLSTVLAIFFGGMALGAWFSARHLHKIRFPIRVYAGVEFAMTLFGAGLSPLLGKLPEVYALFDPGQGPGGTAARCFVAATALLLPTFLMGTTLPILCRGMLTKASNASQGVGILYATNTFGATVGTFATTFVALPLLGLTHALQVAVGANLVAALIAAAKARTERPLLHAVENSENAAAGATASAQGPDRRLQIATGILAFLSGFAFISLEVVWSRIFSTILGGTVYGIGSVLIGVLLGITVGAFIASRIAARVDDGAGALALFWAGTVVTVALLTSCTLPLAYAAQSLESSKGILDPIYWQLLLTLAALSIPTITAGTCFPLLIGIFKVKTADTGKAAGQLYAFNTVGSILGSFLSGFLFLPHLGANSTILMTLALLGVATALTLLLAASTRSRIFAISSLAVVALTLATFDGYSPQALVAARSTGELSYRAFKRGAESVAKSSIYFSEGETSSVSVAGGNFSVSLTLNGLGQGGRSLLSPLGAFESILVATIPLAHTAAPRNALVVGLGAGVTVNTLRLLKIPNIKIAELENKVVDAIDVLYPDDDLLKSPGIELALEDARHLLLLNRADRNGKKERFDLITSMPAHPWVAPAIFTREFFGLAKDNLSPTGVFSTWFGLNHGKEDTLRSLLAAFTEVFQNHLIYFVPDAGAYYLVGSNAPLAQNPRHLHDLAQSPIFADEKRLLDPTYLAMQIIAAGNAKTPPVSAPVVNTDDSAYVELQAPRRKLKEIDLASMPSYFPAPFPTLENIRDERPAAFLARTLGGILKEAEETTSKSLRDYRTAQAKAWLTGIGASLAQGDRQLSAGRVACLAGDLPTAQSSLQPLAGLSGPIAAQAAAALARCSARDPESYRKSLITALPGTAAALALAAEDLDALAQAGLGSPIGVRDAADPDGWLVSLFLEGPTYRLSPVEREAFTSEILPATLRQGGLGAQRLGLAVASRNDLTEAAARLSPVVSSRRAAVSRDLQRRAFKGIKETKDQRTGLGLLLRAATVDPSSVLLFYRIYQVSLEIDDETGLTTARRGLLALGHTDLMLENLDRLLKKAVKESHGTTLFDPTRDLEPEPETSPATL